MKTILAIAATLAAFGLASAQSYPRTRDSSGLKIIENAARMTAPVKFVLSEKPVLEVGGLEDDLTKEFNQRQGYLRGVLLSNGDLAVIDVNRVHLFDAKGKRKTITGRDGAGPGEFRYITAICRTRGDTIVVSDSRNRRITVLDKDAAFVRSLPQPDGGSLPFDGCLNDGTFVLEKYTPGAGAERSSGSRYAVARYRLDGSLVDSLGSFSTGGLDMATGREPQIFAGDDRFGFADGRGDILTAVMPPSPSPGHQLILGNSEVRGFSSGGASIIRSADPAQPIADADREARLMQTIPRGTSADEVKARLDRMRAMSTDKNWPAHRRIHIDDDGRMWVQDFMQDYWAAHGWTAFDRSGRIIGRLMVPKATKRWEVIGFGKNQLVVARQDEDDALHLSVYAITPAPGR